MEKVVGDAGDGGICDFALIGNVLDVLPDFKGCEFAMVVFAVAFHVFYGSNVKFYKSGTV